MELSATLVALATAANKPATFASYRRSWRLFMDFTTAHNITPLDAQIPISSHIIALFVAYLYTKGLQASSIRSHLSALAYSHRMQGYASPCDSFLITKLLKGAAVLSPGGDLRYPITIDILRKLLDVIPRMCVGHYYGPLYCAMCATAFFAFLRCSEMCASPHCLQYSQFGLQSDSAIIEFRTFKHSTPQKKVLLRLESKSDQSICPIYYLHQFVKVRGPRPGAMFCDLLGAPLSRDTFSKHLNLCLKVLRLDTRHYKSHSFRIGAACHALLQGRTEAEIQILGRWSSPTAVQKYLRVAGLCSL